MSYCNCVFQEGAPCAACLKGSVGSLCTLRCGRICDMQSHWQHLSWQRKGLCLFSLSCGCWHLLLRLDYADEVVLVTGSHKCSLCHIWIAMFNTWAALLSADNTFVLCVPHVLSRW
jgi:hypothetical protein